MALRHPGTWHKWSRDFSDLNLWDWDLRLKKGHSKCNRLYVFYVCDTLRVSCTAYSIWSVACSVSRLNDDARTMMHFCRSLLPCSLEKIDQWDWDWRLRSNDTPNAVGCIFCVSCMCCMYVTPCVWHVSSVLHVFASCMRHLCMCCMHVTPCVLHVSFVFSCMCLMYATFLYVCQVRDTTHVACMWLYVWTYIGDMKRHKYFMSHIWMRHIVHINDIFQANGWVMSRTWVSRVVYVSEQWNTCRWVVSCIWMGLQHTHTKPLKHAYEWVMSHMNESCHTRDDMN